MASIAISNASATFPPTTTVKAYLQKGAQPTTTQSGPPPGVSAGEAEVQASGALTITGLTEGSFYLLAAEVAGAYRYLHAYVEKSGETLIIATQASGDFAVTTVGKGYRVAEGSNAKQGTGTLVAGKVTVANTSVTASSRIFLTRTGAITHAGALSVTSQTAGTGFNVESSNAEDAGSFNYEIFEPA